MDAEALRMLADLGLDRRDELSTPDEYCRGRGAYTDPCEQAAVQREVEARRSHASKQEGEGEDARASTLNAWNRASTFERDEVMEQLENRASGQGHRAEMRRRLGTDTYDREDITLARFGEERYRYAQDRGPRLTPTNNSPSPSRRAESFRGLLSSSPSASSGAPPRRFQENLRREAIMRVHNRDRAPDPRASGTTRFVPGGERISFTSGLLRTIGSGQTQGRVSLGPTMTRTTPRAASADTTTNTVSQAPQPDDGVSEGAASMMQSIHAPLRAQRNPTAPSPVRMPATGPRMTSAVRAWVPAEPRFAGTIQSGSNGELSVLTSGGQRRLRDVGREGAAAVRARAAQGDSMSHSPSKENLAPSFPSLQPSRLAIPSLARTAPSDPRATAQVSPTPVTPPLPGASRMSSPSFTPTHASRPSFSPPSVCISSSTPSHTPSEVQRYRMRAMAHVATPGDECDEYYNKHQDQIPYFAAARDMIVKEIMALVKREDERDIKVYVETHPDRVWMVESTKNAKHHIEDGFSEDEIEQYCATHPRHKTFLRAAQYVFTRKSRGSVLAVQPKETAVKSKEITRRPNKIVVRPKEAAVQSKEVSFQSKQVSVKELTIHSAENVGPPSPPSLISVDSDVSADASPSESDHPLPMAGIVTATFLSVTGELLAVHQAKTKVPAHITINVASKSDGYDSRWMKAAIERFAESFTTIDIAARSLSSTSIRTVGGDRQGDDGIWMEEHEAPVSMVKEVVPAVAGAHLDNDGIWSEEL